ncbi:sigma-54 interaction domain-containing protein [Bacillus salipaludis]|uniref:sigma-54 interaction domain-containing protein n=1 Tax=Bacillus salipaludis TaxID=2547811 RepID=UPI002E204256|nr:sigma 54-interacting transcriptional regulator [Bacillus salipaludis]
MEKHFGTLQIELDAILRASKDNIVITDGNGIVLRASPNCQAIYGKDVPFLIGKSVSQLETESIFSPSVTKMVLKAKKEIQVMQHTTTGRVVMATGFPVVNEIGEIIRVISFSHDLTEIENLKEEYEELRTKMEHYQSIIEELREKEESTEDIVIKSKTIQRIWDLVQRVAKSDANVVFYGESGTGKNVFARGLHNKSERKKEAFIEVNCGAIPESLFESEMFGYEEGSFTGANKNGKHGLIELADKGTLFLDEIGELPMSVQAKLLKVLKEKKITRVGGVKVKNIDFRLIASTNQNLMDMVSQGKFRQDLFYRLNVIPIHIPPLRERKEDIAMLAHYQLKKFNEKNSGNKFLDAATIDQLISYNWPGNVRELENLIERVVITTETRAIYPDQLPFYFPQKNRQQNFEGSFDHTEDRRKTLQEILDEVEFRHLRRAYMQYKTTREIAEHLGLSQPTVVRRLKKYGIDSKVNLD